MKESQGIKIMHAIAYDLDTKALIAEFGDPEYKMAYALINKFLADRGFKKKQGSLYYGDDKMTVVKAILAIQDLNREFARFKKCLSDLRILKIMDDDDLKPLL